jgi:serine/threonine protein kinase
VATATVTRSEPRIPAVEAMDAGQAAPIIETDQPARVIQIGAPWAIEPVPAHVDVEKRIWDFVVGDEIAPGRFSQQLLGIGNRYQVYVTWNRRLMAATVLKVIRPHLVRSATALRAMAAEADVLARLQHPGIPRLFAADLDRERPFIEIEFLDGPRLSTLVRRHGRLLPEQLYPLAAQLAATLHYLHGERIVHLDVKPPNIIMGPVPRLIDLSVAHSFDTISGIKGRIGTDAYMAPEQADPERFALIGPASDIWGLGVTLYEAACKRLPFPRGARGTKSSDRLRQLHQLPAPMPAGRVPAEFAELVMSCLDFDPVSRPAPEALFDAFDELAARAGVGRIYLR